MEHKTDQQSGGNVQFEYLQRKYANGVPEYLDHEQVTTVGAPGSDFGYGATCTSHAEYIATHEGGLVCGFFVEDNPCDMESYAEGHDFALIHNRYIVDTWLCDWVQEIETPVLDMENPDDQETIRRWYGDQEKWERRLPALVRVEMDKARAQLETDGITDHCGNDQVFQNGIHSNTHMQPEVDSNQTMHALYM